MDSSGSVIYLPAKGFPIGGLTSSFAVRDKKRSEYEVLVDGDRFTL